MSAESNIVTPASRQMSTRRVASATSVEPQALKSGVVPPKVPVPRQSAGTLKPEPPSRRYSIGFVTLRVLDACPGKRGDEILRSATDGFQRQSRECAAVR